MDLFIYPDPNQKVMVSSLGQDPPSIAIFALYILLKKGLLIVDENTVYIFNEEIKNKGCANFTSQLFWPSIVKI